MHQFFVTGTDTDTGKTVITSGLLRAFNREGFKTAGYKPISAGCDKVDGELHNSDAKLLQAASSVELTLREVNPIAFELPIAPHIAAEKLNTQIDANTIVRGWQHLVDKHPDIILTEGAGGWMLPISRQETLPEVLKRIPQPVILVIGLRLGCLNHALLTVKAIQADGFVIAGWVANHLSDDMFMAKHNIDTLKTMIPAPCLGIVPRLACTANSAKYLSVDALLDSNRKRIQQ